MLVKATNILFSSERLVSSLIDFPLLSAKNVFVVLQLNSSISTTNKKIFSQITLVPLPLLLDNSSVNTTHVRFGSRGTRVISDKKSPNSWAFSNFFSWKETSNSDNSMVHFVRRSTRSDQESRSVRTIIECARKYRRILHDAITNTKVGFSIF